MAVRGDSLVYCRKRPAGLDGKATASADLSHPLYCLTHKDTQTERCGRERECVGEWYSALNRHKRTTLSYIFFRYRIWEKRFLQNGTPLFLRGGGAPARNEVTKETCPIEMLVPYYGTNFDNKKYQSLKTALINRYPHRPGRWRQAGQVFTAAETGKMQLQAKAHWGLQEKSLWETLRRHDPVTPWLKTSACRTVQEPMCLSCLVCGVLLLWQRPWELIQARSLKQDCPTHRRSVPCFRTAESI